MSYEDLVLDQDNNFYLITLSILNTSAGWYMYIIGRSYMLITSES